MRFVCGVTAMLLSLLIGVTVWALMPTHKVFSWVETSELDYLVGALPSSGRPPIPPAVPFNHYPEALESLRAQVKGRYFPYVSLGTLGRRLTLKSGHSFPIFNESYVSEGFFKARQVNAQYGRLVHQGDESAIVLGHKLAREIFGDPSLAVGQAVELGSPISPNNVQSVEIIGVLTPSPAQDPHLDVDEGIVGILGSDLAAEVFNNLDILPLIINIRFRLSSDIQDILPELEMWAKGYFGSEGRVVSANSFVDDRRITIQRTLPRIAARHVTFVSFGITLAFSALLALYAQSYYHLLRRRQLLGVEKALGATRRQLTLRLIGTQLPWGLVGGLLGGFGVWSLYDILPKVFLTRPPIIVLVAAVLTPLLALLVLAAVASWPLLTQSAMSLLRGRMKGSRVRPLFILVYGGLAFALAGGLAASQVFVQVQREVEALQTQFGLMYSLQAGDAVIDDRTDRAFEAGSDFSPVFTSQDAKALEDLRGVREATVAQTLPNLSVTFNDVSTQLRAVAADDQYLEFMELQLIKGDAAGCVLTETSASDLGIAVGQELVLAGLQGPLPCQISGILQNPPELWSWLVQDLPELIVPPLDGLGLPLPGYNAIPFRSIRILVKLSSPEAELAVREWQATNFPDVQAELLPYTPDVETLLSSLRIQAQLFLLISLLAAVLSIWGIIGGFLALLEAERFRIALDRALGLSLQRMSRRWWFQTLGLGLLSSLLGLAIGYLFTVRLYNALALNIPNLPSRDTLVFSSELVIIIIFVLFILSAGLTLMATRWMKRQSSLTLLKEGV